LCIKVGKWNKSKEWAYFCEEILSTVILVPFVWGKEEMVYYYYIIIIIFIALSNVCCDRVIKITYSITLW
jgi:hypothetical protein